MCVKCSQWFILFCPKCQVGGLRFFKYLVSSDVLLAALKAVCLAFFHKLVSDKQNKNKNKKQTKNGA